MNGKTWVFGSLFAAITLIATAASPARAEDHRWNQGRAQWQPPTHAGWFNRDRGNSDWGHERSNAWWRREQEQRWWQHRQAERERRHEWWQRHHRDRRWWD